MYKYININKLYVLWVFVGVTQIFGHFLKLFSNCIEQTGAYPEFWEWGGGDIFSNSCQYVAFQGKNFYATVVITKAWTARTKTSSMRKSNLHVCRAQAASFYSINSQWLIVTSALNHSKTNDNYSKRGGASGAYSPKSPLWQTLLCRTSPH